MPDIVISEFMDPDAIEPAARDFDVHYDPQLVEKPAELQDLLKDALGLVVRNRTRVNSDLLDYAPKLKVIGRLGVGLDNIDVKACERRKVKVCPATGANDAAVAEWVIASVMLLLRQAFFCQAQMLTGKWPRNQAMGHETAGKTIGLVGFGRIARETARLAQSLGMTVLAFDPFVPADDPCWKEATRFDKLGEMLPQSDAVSLHVPLTDTTHHLIDADAIAQMKKGAIVINASRGGVLDEKALVDAIGSGRIKGAALDVYETEPLTAKAASRFAGLPNLVLTPHIGGVTVESNQRVSRVTIANVLQVLEAAK